MKKFLQVSLFLFLFSCFCSAQNLVPNPSFEDTVMCSDAGGQVARARYWYASEKTPDYFNECCVVASFSVPTNLFSSIYAKTGYAYCGFMTYSTIDTTYREKIGVPLSSPLNIGTRYFVSFKLTVTNRYVNGANNKTGALFSTVKYTDTNPPPTNDFCQMWTDSIITDSTHWVQVWGSFVADSAYTYLTIGNFFTNAHTDTIRLWQTNVLQAYYFIDDVCVSEDSALCVDNPVSVNSLQGRKNELEIYPNPANNFVVIKTEINPSGVLQFFTAEGAAIFRKNIPSGYYEWKEDVTGLNNGIYFIEIITDQKVISKKLIINH